MRTRVAVVTLGCGRNEVDSAQVGGALEAAGLAVTDDPARADCVLVNTCTFIEAARQESVETILAACDLSGASGDGPAPTPTPPRSSRAPATGSRSDGGAGHRLVPLAAILYAGYDRHPNREVEA